MGGGMHLEWGSSPSLPHHPHHLHRLCHAAAAVYVSAARREQPEASKVPASSGTEEASSASSPFCGSSDGIVLGESLAGVLDGSLATNLADSFFKQPGCASDSFRDSLDTLVAAAEVSPEDVQLLLALGGEFLFAGQVCPVIL